LVVRGENFFPASLAPKKRNPPKFQLEMAVSVKSLKTTMESMATQFKGFQEMMATSLNKLSALEAWHITTEESMDTLLQRSTETTTRIGWRGSRAWSSGHLVIDGGVDDSSTGFLGVDRGRDIAKPPQLKPERISNGGLVLVKI
jgi:hypothetical protein